MTYQQRNVNKPDNPYKTTGDSANQSASGGITMAGINYSMDSVNYSRNS